MLRYRVISNPQAPGAMVFKPLDGATVSYTYPKPFARHKMMYDEVIEHFKRRSAAGEIFNNTLSSTDITFSSVGGYDGGTQVHTGVNAGKSTRYTYTNGGCLQEMYNGGGLAFPNVPFDSAEADATSAIECLANVNATETDALNFIAEWSKTKTLYRDIWRNVIELLIGGAMFKKRRDRITKVPLYDSYGRPILNKKGKPVYKYVHDLTGGLRGNESEKTQSLANAYLAVRMGLLPLVNDLQGAIKALLSGNPKRQTARGQVIQTGQSASSIDVADGPGIFQVNLTTTRVLTTRRGILYETSTAGKLAAQFGLSRPLSSIWESIPWSFVFDWFFKVGTWLDAMQPSFASKTLSAWVSTRDVTVHTASVNQSLSKANGDVSTTAASWNESVTKVTIIKNRAPWEPTLPKHPSLGTGLHDLRCLDAFALSAQLLSSFFLKR